MAQAAAGKRIAELAAEVERSVLIGWTLTEQLAEAETRERKAVEAAHDLDRRIEKALTLLNHPTEVNGCNCLAHQIADILRGGVVIRPEDCTCPRWQPTQCGPDGTPEDYACPDDACRCPVHCWDEDHDRPTWEALASEGDDD